MKKAFVTKEMVEEIVKTYPTPFHIYDEKGIRENAKALKAAFAWNKGYKEYFAVKATPNPFLIDILRDYGCGCDCSSMTELMLSEAMGVKGEDIMFSSNDTPAEEFVYADKIGAIINLDDFTHIDFLEKTIGHLPKTLSCRYNPGGYFAISNNIMDNPGDAKYGMTTDQMFEAYKVMKEKGVENFGIHAFLASNTVTNEYYPTLAKQLFELAVKLKEETGAHIAFINLSGGIGIPYKPDQEPNDIMAIGEGVRKVYEEVLIPAGMGDVAIYTELGRFMMAPYGHLVTKVLHEKHTHKEYIGVDACAVNLMRPAMYGAYHHITVLGKEEVVCDHKYDVVGSLCENNDKFAIDRMLPEIEMGDYIDIHDTGSHGFSMGYNYNGKLKSAELLLKEDGSVQLIRRAETPKDYFATFDCFEIFRKMFSMKDLSQEKYDIIIQAGQSNSQGYGHGRVDEPYEPNELVWYMNEDFSITQAVETVIGNEIRSTFALSFAKEYIDKGFLKEGRKLLILRCAVGATGFLDHRWDMTGDLYLHMIEMTQKALSMNKENRLVGILWHQGETDVINGATYDGHYNYLMGLVRSVGERFQVPAIPFIAGDFVQEWKNELLQFCIPVIDAIRDVCRDYEKGAFVETEGLKSNWQEWQCNVPGWESQDKIHFSRKSVYELGKRYFKEYCKLVE